MTSIEKENEVVRSRLTLGIVVAVAALAIAAVVMPLPGRTQTESTAYPETVTVTAAGKVEGRPDLATVSFGIREEAQSADEAMDRLAVSTDRVFDALLGAGLSEDQVTTQDVELYKDYDYVDDRRVFVAYVAATGIRAETRNLDEIGKIIDVGVEAGANSVRGINFERTNQNEALQEALRQAMNLATMKAQELATTAGRQLGRALVIEEGGARAPSPPQPLARSISADAGGVAAIRISPPSQTTLVRIVVTFALS